MKPCWYACWYMLMSHDTQDPVSPSLRRSATELAFSRGGLTGLPTDSDGYGSIPIDTFLVGWTSIYQLFWCSPGVQGFDTSPDGDSTQHVFGTNVRYTLLVSCLSHPIRHGHVAMCWVRSWFSAHNLPILGPDWDVGLCTSAADPPAHCREDDRIRVRTASIMTL